MAIHDLFDKVYAAYQSRYNQSPSLVIRAPGRVNIIGEHTDYNDGFVLPVAVDRAAWLAVGSRDDASAEVTALDMHGNEKMFSLDPVAYPSAGGWSAYPMGVAWVLETRGLKPSGINAVLASDVPVGAGLSSSAAVELAFAFAWNKLGGWGIAPPDLALICQRAENKYVGVNCGIMDQMISACGKAGHAMMLDSRSLERQYFAMPDDIAILVADSLVRRSLSTSEYNTRRAQCEGAVSILQQHLPHIKALRDVSSEELERHKGDLSEIVYRRARHVVTEDERVMQLANSLVAGQMDRVGELLLEGHRSLRDDYEVSIPALDTLVASASEADGCFGARLTGAGFGGCIVALVDRKAVDVVSQHMGKVYHREYGKYPAVYVTRPADGASDML